MTDLIAAGELVVSAEALPLLREVGLVSFDDFMNFEGGTRICHKRGRSVFRFEAGGRAFYLKRNRIHRVEFWKALMRLRRPSLGAMVEWQNILALQKAGIPTVTPVAAGERRRCGLEIASFTLTEEIYGAEPLDRVARRDCLAGKDAASRSEKRRLLKSLADLARKFHTSGMNHQDFYLNHFFRGEDGTLYLLDLQRVGRRSTVPQRYLVKDLAQLNYSATFVGGISRSDRLRFFLAYLGLASLGRPEKRLARLVAAKTDRIARHDVKLAARRRSRGELPNACKPLN